MRDRRFESQSRTREAQILTTPLPPPILLHSVTFYCVLVWKICSLLPRAKHCHFQYESDIESAKGPFNRYVMENITTSTHPPPHPPSLQTLQHVVNHTPFLLYHVNAIDPFPKKALEDFSAFCFLLQQNFIYLTTNDSDKTLSKKLS